MDVAATSRRMREQHKDPIERAIIDLCDEFYHARPGAMPANPSDKEKKETKRACIAFIKERKAKSGLLMGILWIGLRWIIAKIVSKYIEDLIAG